MCVFAQLLAAGRSVVAAVRDAEKAKQIFGELGLQAGYQQDKSKVREAVHCLHQRNDSTCLRRKCTRIYSITCC